MWDKDIFSETSTLSQWCRCGRTESYVSRMRPRIAEKRCVAAAVMFALGAGSQMGETALSSWHIWVQLNDVANADRTFGFFWLTFASASWHVQVPRSCLLLKAWRVTRRFTDAGRPGQAQRWDGQRLRTLRSSSLSGTKRRLVMERETQHGARQRLSLFINYPHLPWFVQLCLSSMVW